jgi:hypothetical protein
LGRGAFLCSRTGLVEPTLRLPWAVHLFGLLELGYAAAGIRFPDCPAYKAAVLEPDRDKPVRIEFELKSSNFAKHGHDPKGCDEIVCWEDAGCPVKVVELRGELERVRRESA